jgi:hypothetical protein
MAGFAEELRAANTRTAPTTQLAQAAAASAAAPTETPQEAAAAPAAEMTGLKDGQVIELGLPVGSSPVDPSAVANVEPVKAVAKVDDSPKIRIAGKEFANMQEAIKYAEELELAKREDDAFKEGFKTAKGSEKKADEPPPKTYVEEAEELLFENPKKALEILKEGVRKEIFDTYDKMTADQQAAQTKQQQLNQIWEHFYTENADLAEAKEYVDYVLQRNWETLGGKPISESLPILAEQARKGLKITKQSASPAKELPSKPAVTAGASSSSTGAQVQATPKKDMDFVSQLNTLRKRK